jgi:iron complex transport system ATP-binding protein
MTEDLLCIRDITCQYGTANILEGINLRLKTGNFLGILGPNASGKTSLIRSSSGLLKPISGNIDLDGQDLYSMGRKEIAKKIASVPQTAHYDPYFSVFESVLMGRTPHLGWLENEDEKDLEIAVEAMRLLGIEELATRRLGELSGGEIQKMLIARALTQQPSILLLDEPTTHLDISSKIGAMNLIKSLCLKDKLAVMAVFHDLNLAARYCDSAILLKDGRSVASGPIDQVIKRETIGKTFGLNVEVKRHTRTGCIFVVPLLELPIERNHQGKRIHLVCGGGTGSALMTELTHQGFLVSTGVLNVLDTDNETAHELAIPVIDEAPFSPISDENHERHLEMISTCQLVILSNVPFGRGNIKNLQAVLWALNKGKRILIVEGEWENTDFIEGTASEYLLQLREGGAKTVHNNEEALSEVKDLFLKESTNAI